MKRMACLGLGLAAVVLVALPAQAEPNDREAALAMFERFKALEGQWRAESTAGWSEITRYEVIARGSVVMSSTEFRDAPDRKMVTMFYVDGDRLVAVHYCEARNQPFLVATELDPAAGTVRFEFDHGGNLPDRDHGHMDSAVYQLPTDDDFSSRWSWFQDGEHTWSEDIHLERLPASSEAGNAASDDEQLRH